MGWEGMRLGSIGSRLFSLILRKVSANVNFVIDIFRFRMVKHFVNCTLVIESTLYSFEKVRVTEFDSIRLSAEVR